MGSFGCLAIAASVAGMMPSYLKKNYISLKVQSWSQHILPQEGSILVQRLWFQSDIERVSPL